VNATTGILPVKTLAQVQDGAWTTSDTAIGTMDRAEVGYSVQTIKEGRLRIARRQAPVQTPPHPERQRVETKRGKGTQGMVRAICKACGKKMKAWGGGR
jgi:hypothetical protein